MRTIRLAAAIMAGLAVAAATSGHARDASDVVAQKTICAACQPYGAACCALQGSVAACVQCSLGYGYKHPEQWCRTHVPRCSR